MRTSNALMTIFIVGPCLSSTSAAASPCAEQIRQIEQTIQRASRYPALPQTVNAQLHHQPTTQSVESAAEAARSEASVLLGEAKVLDADGNTGECETVVSKLMSLLEL